MNKFLAILFLISISSCTVAGSFVKISIICPNTTLIREAILNYGSFVGGTGTELVLNKNQTLPVFFRSQGQLPKGTPGELNDYDSHAVSFASKTGTVSCEYKSPNPANPHLLVSYQFANAKGAKVKQVDTDHIDLAVLSHRQ